MRRLTCSLTILGAALIAMGAAPAPRVRISPVTGRFFANPSGAGEFSAGPATPEAFRKTFPIINFNPPAGTVPCTAAAGIDMWTRPFTNVVPHADGSCSTVVAAGNGLQAGVDALHEFNAVFTGAFTVSSPGPVTLNFYSDDGWVLGIGPGPGAARPTRVSGQMVNAPAVTPFSRFAVVGSYNGPSAPARNDLVVDFRTAGTYPFELDYSECCAGQLALTLTANGEVLVPGGPPHRTAWEALMDTTTLVATFALLAFMVERLTNGIATVAGYSRWWRERMEVPATADPDARARIERNRRVGLFALSALLGIVGTVAMKLDFLARVGFDAVKPAPPTEWPGVAELARYVVTGLLVAAGADPIRELLKSGERQRDTPPLPMQVTGTLIVQQSPGERPEPRSGPSA